MTLLLLIACGPSPDGTPTLPGTAPPPTDTDLVGLDTGDTDALEPELFRPEQLDCANLPPLPETFTGIPGLGPHEDFTFDAQGNLVGVDGVGNLRAEPRDGGPTLLSPGVGAAKGTRFLPDGSVVVALPENGTVDRVVPGGGQTLHAAVPNANGLAIDLHGNTWAATSNGTVERITPDGERLVVVDLPATLDGITFSPDFRVLYFNSEFGQIRRILVDDDGEPIGDPESFASVQVGFAVLDGMTTDMCGNLYAARMDGRVYRFLPDGTPDGFINFASHPGFEVVPAVNFGPGVGGFERDHLYAMNFLGGVIEADIGLDGRWEPHFAIPQ